jgi:beta-lactamase class D
VKNENETLNWDGKKRQFPAWNKNHTLRSAIKYSVVWVYQELAKKIGKERMMYFLKEADYGNKDISAGVDLFWLEGNFKISQVDQIKFLIKLHENKLPFSLKTMKTVKDMIINEKTQEYTLYAKTGLAMRKNPMTGWWVGWVTYKGNAYFFANNMELDINKPAAWGLRISITKAIFKMLGINIK